jgi:hypothetical protein
MSSEETALVVLKEKTQVKFNLNGEISHPKIRGCSIVSIASFRDILEVGIVTTDKINITLVVQNVDAFRVNRFSGNEVISKAMVSPLASVSPNIYQELSLFREQITEERLIYKNELATLGVKFLTIKFGNNGFLFCLISSDYIYFY